MFQRLKSLETFHVINNRITNVMVNSYETTDLYIGFVLDMTCVHKLSSMRCFGQETPVILGA